ncbi:MAG: HDOD domain-containing protein [Spirochaetota bacterium]|nr:HDOD domain-containing protein [Spirochaetota bacterium]
MQTTIQQRIESVINNIESLPSIPVVASQVVRMVSDPDVPFKSVAEEIAKDQAITTNILKLCNSAYFNRGKEISSIERAVVTLGLKEVKDIVMVVTTKTILDKEIMGYSLEKGELWKHGLAVAILSKRIALMKKKKEIADITFTGGIIHDVGKTVLAMFVQKTFQDILSFVENTGVTFQEAEKEIMGYDHQIIGENILTKWQFPPVLNAIVRYHHNPNDAPEEFKLIVSIVHIANVICLMAGIGIGSDGLYHEMNETAIKRAGLNDRELEQLYSYLPDVLGQAAEIL